MGDVQRRAQITVEGLRLRKREWLVERRQARLRKALRDDRLAIAWFDKNLK
jgi:ribosomal protein L30/L7E